MDLSTVLLCLAAGSYFCFRYGKQLGSRRAFGVGYRRARRRFRRRGRSAHR